MSKKWLIVTLVLGVLAVGIFAGVQGYLWQAVVFVGEYVAKTGIVMIIWMGVKKMIIRWIVTTVVRIALFFHKDWTQASAKARIRGVRAEILARLREQHPVFYAGYVMVSILVVGAGVWTMMVLLGVMHLVGLVLNWIMGYCSTWVLSTAIGKTVARVANLLRVRAKYWHDRVLAEHEEYESALIRLLRRTHRKVNPPKKK